MRAERLESLEHILIENINRKPYSFWEVLEVDSGKTMLLQDVLTGGRMEVQDRSDRNTYIPVTCFSAGRCRSMAWA